MAPLRHRHRQVGSALLAVALLVLSFHGHLTTVDAGASAATACSLWDRGSLAIDPRLQDDPLLPKGRDGETYSRIGIAPALLMVPLVPLADWAGAVSGLGRGRALEALIPWLSLAAAVLAWLELGKLASQHGYGEGARQRLCWGLIGGTSLWFYAVGDQSEMLQTALLCGWIGALFREERSGWRPGWWLAVLIGVKISYAPLLGVGLVYRLWVDRAAHQGAWISQAVRQAIPPIAILTAIFYLNWLRWGSPWELGYGGYASQISWTAVPANLWRLFFSLEYGLIPFNPILVVAILGWIRHWDVWPRHKLLLLLAVVVMVTGTYSVTAFLSGGWGWGNRYLSPLLPLLGLGLAGYKPPVQRVARLLVLVVWSASFLIQIVSITQKFHEYFYFRYTLPDSGVTMPALPGHLALFTAKLSGCDGQYPGWILGAPHGSKLDSRAFESYPGFNLWYFHLTRLVDASGLFWLFVAWLVAAGSVYLFGAWSFCQRTPEDPQPE